MKKVPVGVYRIGPTFSTATEAIKHGLSYPPLLKAKAEAKFLSGSQIIDGYWTDTDFVIRFSNCRVLHIYVDPIVIAADVKWRLSDEEPDLAKENVDRVGDSPCLLEFEGGRDYLMDRSALFAQRRGKDFKDFFVNDHGFYVYTSRQMILCFGRVYRRDNRQNLLYVYEDD